MRPYSSVLILLALVALPAFPDSGGTPLNFDNFVDGTTVGGSLQSVTFLNAVAISAGITLNEFEFPAHSGSNVVYDRGGPVTLLFSTPIQSFSGYFTYGTQVTIQAFGNRGNQLVSGVSRYSNNEALSGAAGSSPNELIRINAPGISKIVITGNLAGDSFTLDDATASPYSACDLNQDGSATAFDVVQLVTAAAMGQGPGGDDLNVDGVVNVLDAQILVNAAMNQPCAVPPFVAQSGASFVPRSLRPAFLPRANSSGPSIGTPTTTPSYVPSTIAANVNVTAAVAGSGIITHGINLLRLPAGSQPAILGVMQDPSAGQSTLQVNFDEPSAGTVQLVVSAATQGALRRVWSAAGTLSVWKSFNSLGLYLQYPTAWTRFSTYPYGSSVYLGYLTNGDIDVLEATTSPLNGAASLQSFAANEIANNNCLDAAGNPVDHVIQSSSSSAIYVLSCSASSEVYTYVALNSAGKVVKLSYHDDFDPNASESQKVATLQEILKWLTIY